MFSLPRVGAKIQAIQAIRAIQAQISCQSRLAVAKRKREGPVYGVTNVKGGRAQLGEPLVLGELGAAGDVATRAHYADAAYYTKTYASRKLDVGYYARLAERTRGPILEYGAGNGRILVPMAETGVEVVGVDLSAEMLGALAKRAKSLPDSVRRRISWKRGDMRTLRLRRKFPLVLATFNTVLHLYERRDIERFFARVHEHLSPRGRFVFDFSVPHGEDLVFDPDRSYGAPPIRHPTTGQITRYAERFEYDLMRQIMLIQMEFRPGRGDAWSVPLTHRQFFPAEMEALLHYNGFTDIRFTADFTDRPPSNTSDTLVVTCRSRRTKPPASKPAAKKPARKKPARKKPRRSPKNST